MLKSMYIEWSCLTSDIDLTLSYVSAMGPEYHRFKQRTDDECGERHHYRITHVQRFPNMNRRGISFPEAVKSWEGVDHVLSRYHLHLLEKCQEVAGWGSQNNAAARDSVQEILRPCNL